MEHNQNPHHNEFPNQERADATATSSLRRILTGLQRAHRDVTYLNARMFDHFS